MVSVNPNPVQAQGFYMESSGMALPGINSLPPAVPVSDDGGGAVVPSDDLNKKVRKSYTITKSRESWTEQEHDKFLEALQLFDLDWKKIEAFVGSKTVIQIRSHAQKYFMKVQKNGSNERVPPPRPKRKAAHPYPQKASKIAHATGQPTMQYAGCPTAVCEPGYVNHSDPSAVLTVQGGRYVNHSDPSAVLTVQGGGAPASSWTHFAVNSSNKKKDDAASTLPVMAPTCCSSSNEGASNWSTARPIYQTNPENHFEVTPDFAQVYGFIGSVFDPNASDHLGRLKKMDPINVETVLLLMKNLSVNLMNPEFEEHRKLLSSYDAETGKIKCSPLIPALGSSKTMIPAV